MKIELNMRVAKWKSGEYPDVIGRLRSRDIVFVHQGRIYSGHYHCNRYFYADSGISVSHAEYGHGQETPWQYTEEAIS